MVLSIVEAIATYGLIPVAIAVFVVLMFKINKRFTSFEENNNKLMQENSKRISDQQEAVNEMTNKLMMMMVQNTVHSKEEEEDNRKVNAFIDSQLKCLLSEEKANRAYMFTYHNGGRDITGRGFQKMSITQEVVDFNTVPIMGSYQNVPRAMFPTLFKTLVSQDVYYIEDIEGIKETDPMSYQMFLTHGVKSALINAVKTMNGIVVGFIVLEYSSSSCQDFSKAKKTLEKKALRISGALINKEE